MEKKLCPKCGAYWSCDCEFEPSPRVDWSAAHTDGGCEHDWTEVLGVELDEAVTHGSEALVLLCRLCGLYAVEERV